LLIKFSLYFPDVKITYNRLKASAKRRGIPFDLTLVDLNNLSYPMTCPILGMRLKFNNKLMDDSYSIDRIDSNKGYEIDNIIVISWKANRLKNNASNEELEKISNFYNNLC